MIKSIFSSIQRFGASNNFISDASKLVVLNIITSLGGRVINIAITFVVIPIMLSTLSRSDYGILAVFLSISTFFSYGDFGIGSALVTSISSTPREDEFSLAGIISETWRILWIGAVFVLIAGLILYTWGIAGKIIPEQSPLNLILIWFSAIGAAAIGVPMAISQRIYFAFQLGIQSQIWLVATRVFILLFSIIGSFYKFGLLYFILINAWIPTIFATVWTCYTFLFSYPQFRPSFIGRKSSLLFSRSLEGFQYMFLHLCLFLETGLDPILISSFTSTERIAEFDITTRLYNYIPALIQLGTIPLWPAIAKARSGNQKKWLKRMLLVIHFVVPLVASVASILVLVMFNKITSLWVGDSISIGAPLRIFGAIFAIIESVTLMQTYIMNGLNMVKINAYIIFLSLIILIPLKIILLTFIGDVGLLQAFCIVVAVRVCLSGFLLSRFV